MQESSAPTSPPRMGPVRSSGGGEQAASWPSAIVCVCSARLRDGAVPALVLVLVSPLILFCHPGDDQSVFMSHALSLLIDRTILITPSYHPGDPS